MIAPLRARHRLMTGALAVLLPVGFAAGLAARAPIPANRSLAHDGDSVELQDGAGLGIADVFPGTSFAMRARIRRASHAVPDRDLLELTPGREIEAPDLLLYWSREQATGGDFPYATPELPVDSILFGKLAGIGTQGFVLPEAATGGGGYVHLYSLAGGVVLSTSPLERFGP